MSATEFVYKGKDLFGNYVVHAPTVQPTDRFDLLFSSAREAHIGPDVPDHNCP